MKEMISIQGVWKLFKMFRKKQKLPEGWRKLLNDYIERRKRLRKRSNLIREAEGVKRIISEFR